MSISLLVLLLVGLAGITIIWNTTESAANTTAGDDDKVKSKPSSQLNPANSESKLYLGL